MVNKMFAARRDIDRCMEDITKSTTKQQSFYTTLKYVLQWNISQRWVWSNILFAVRKGSCVCVFVYRVLLGFMIFLLGRLSGGSFIA